MLSGAVWSTQVLSVGRKIYSFEEIGQEAMATFVEMAGFFETAGSSIRYTKLLTAEPPFVFAQLIESSAISLPPQVSLRVRVNSSFIELEDDFE